MKRSVCADCPHLQSHDMHDSKSVIFACHGVKQPFVVPQKGQIDPVKGKVWMTTFTRIPLNCPLDDETVVKSENPVPVSYRRTVRTKIK